MSNGLKVISPGLFDADAGIYRRIPSSAGQILAVLERNVLALQVPVHLRQPEIYNEDR